ncbi:MAG: hypothetical protein WAL26_14960 [Mycobacterium sp.]
MNTTPSRGLVRLVAGSVAAAGIVASILGFASVANASTPPTASNAGGLMQASNAGGLMQATTPKA